MFQRTKICSGLLMAFGAIAVHAQDTPSTQRVEITGSSIKRVDAETSVPVTVIQADDLKKQGVTTVEEILQNISAAQVQQGSAQSVGLGTGGASFADLRGLGANKTLVLLNGRRIANQALDSSAPDLNMIPFAAIERVEVLRDGASALYGTDAISGVINFITRKDYRGGNITIGFDKPGKAGGTQRSANASFGVGDLDKDRINVFGTIDYQNQQAVLSTQRPYYQKQYLSHGAFGSSNSTAPASWFGVTNASAIANPDDPVLAETPGVATNGCPADQHLYNKSATHCGEITTDFIGIVPASERISGFGHATVKIDDNNFFNLEAFTSHSVVKAITAPVPYGGIEISASSPYYPGHGITPGPTDGSGLSADQSAETGVANGDLVTYWRDTYNGYREDTNIADQARVVASVEGTIKDWDYEFGLMHNQNTTKDVLTHGYTNINILAPFDNTDGDYVLSNAINPFSATQTAAGQALLNSAVVNGTLQSGTGKVDTVDGHVGHELPDWFKTGTPGQIALGFEGRREVFDTSANFPVADAVQVSTGLDPSTHNGGTRNVWAGYFEWDLPVLKTVDVTLAGRYDHYSDFGSTFNPKASFKFTPSKRFLLRGSYTTGFRAPSLYELYQSQSYTNSGGGQNDPGHSTIDANGNCNGTYLTACDQQFQELQGGNKSLKPERSHNMTFGTVLEPIDNLTAEFDYWNIRYNNQIGVLADSTLFDPTLYAENKQFYHYNNNDQLSISSLDCVPANNPKCGYVSTQNNNLGGVHTDGVDIALGYKMSAGRVGRFNLGLNSTWVRSYKYENFEGGPYIQNVGIFSGTGPIFRWTHNGTAVWNLDPFSIGWAIHYKSGYEEPAKLFANTGSGTINAGQTTSPAYKVSAYTTMDLYGSFAQAKGYSVTVGVKNFTDSKAPFSYNVNQFQTGYDARFSDPVGRTYYVRGTYSF